MFMISFLGFSEFVQAISSINIVIKLSTTPIIKVPLDRVSIICELLNTLKQLKCHYVDRKCSTYV